MRTAHEIIAVHALSRVDENSSPEKNVVCLNMSGMQGGDLFSLFLYNSNSSTYYI